MRNISESPEGNEQARVKAGTSRQSAAQPKESATPGGQDQEGKTLNRRRNAAATTGTATGSTASSRTDRPAGTRARGAQAQPTGAPTSTPAQHTPTPTSERQSSSHAATSKSATTGASPHRQTTNGSSTGSTAQRPARPETASRPASAASQTAPRQTTRAGSVQTRPASSGHSSRPGQGTAHPNGSRQATVAHPAHGRSATRPGTPIQRPVERRVAAVKEKPTGPVAIPPQIIVKDLADLLHATPNEVIRNLIKHGVFASINQVVEYENAATVARELGFEPEQSAPTVTPAVQSERGLSANEIMMATRNDRNTVVIPPVVTIMGHVDHGKTSLLDTIRKTKVAAGEAGGITQHIGAYQVEVDGKKITFLDTPGHEAFTAMRARGAQVTHIAVIVVAADDGVMPQTREAISHAQAAKVPIIIAINKIDKDNANPDFVKQQLAEMGLVVEEYGGDIVSVPVSARKNIGIDDLLEMILLVAEMQDIRANPNMPAVGTIIEAKLDKTSGPTATVLVQQGTLKMGDNIVVGPIFGKVRAMFNDRGKRIQKAPPSTPVSILGLPEVPNAGDRLEVVADERTARQMAEQIAEQRRRETGPLGQVSLDTLYMQMQEGNVKELNIVLKGDVQGSVEAIKNALSKVSEENEAIKVRLIHEGVGNISETDVHLASASKAIIIAFNVKADGAALRLAQKEGVDIRYYNVIYKLIDDIQAAMIGMLEPTYREVVEGHAEIIQTFKAGRNTVIAGCRVTDGKITRSASARVMRKNEKVYEGKIASLRRGKDDVREVASGYECGVVLEDFTDFEIGDVIEAFAQERVKPGM